jgi:AcrR family transcriptional regulator
MTGPADRPAPPYIRIAAEISRRITVGQLRPGDRLPSARQITQEWGVAIATATKVLATLRHDGLARSIPGIGTVVAAPEPGHAPARAPRLRQAREAEPELTRDRIVRTATAIADAEGLPALSMRRVAAELRVATMSLYRHVPNKGDLVLLMADAVFGEERLPDTPPPGWRNALELAARSQWAIHRKHPWIAHVVSFTRPMLAPNAMAHTEWAMRAINGPGLDLPTVLRVVVAVSGYVHGIAANLDSEIEAEQDTGVTSDEWLAAQEQAFNAIVASGRFPLMSEAAARPEFDLALNTIFELGLKLMLDGLTALIEDSSSRSERESS